MRLIVLIALLLPLSWLSAQSDSNHYSHRNRSGSEIARPTESLRTSYQRKEAQLQGLLSVYGSLSDAEQENAAREARTLLYEMFDISIEEKRQEAMALKARVDLMEGNPEYQDRADELQRLREQIEKIESNLRYRASYREQIVSQRLEELL